MSPKNPEKSWREAIIVVLEKAQEALHYTTIAERIREQQLRKTFGATPAQTVVAIIATDIKNKGNASAFVRSAEGTYLVRNGLPELATLRPNAPATLGQATATVPDEEETVGVIQAFGMYWRREAVKWDTTPQLLGQYDRKSLNVNFCNQKGIYLLHDNSRTVYVGRSVDRPLGRRLYEHASDRLAGRWNQFSWFGLSQVTPEGALKDTDLLTLTSSVLIATLEALLIEAVEPPLNRKRGDEFRAVEYLQVEDPHFMEQKEDAILLKMLAKRK